MDAINRAIVALDLSSMDDQIMQYTAMIAKPLQLNSLDFIHVIPAEYIQTGREYGMPEGSSLINMVESRIRNKIQEKIKQYLQGTDIDIKINVLEGNPVKALLEYINERSVDLLIVGRKEHSAGSGITAKKIARKAKCNFLFVPETTFLVPQTVMVPVDFSANSAEAIFAALTLKAANPKLRIIAPHVIRLLPSDYYYGMDHNPDFLDAHLKKNKEAYNYFIKEYEIPAEKIEPIFLEDHNNSIGRRLLDYFNKEDFDLVIIGAQGHTALNTLLYGSVTERIVHYCDDTPLLVVR